MNEDASYLFHKGSGLRKYWFQQEVVCKGATKAVGGGSGGRHWDSKFKIVFSMRNLILQ